MDELTHKIMKCQEALAENRAKHARLIGQVEGIFSSLSGDKPFVEGLRVQSWMRAKPELVVTSDGTGFNGVPDGWPNTVPDPTAHIEEDIARRRDAYIESKFGQTETTEREPSVTPSISRFREMTGLGDET